MKRFGWLVAIVMVISLGSVVFLRRSGPPTVAVIKPLRRDVTRTLAVTGQVEAIDNANLAAGLSGIQITKMLVDKGDHVTEGQPVLLLDDRELRAAAEQTAAQVRQAEANLLKARAQAQGAGLSVTLAQQAVDDSIELKTQRDQAAANVQAAKERLTQARQNAIRTREGARQQAVRQAQAQLRQAEAQARLAILNFKRSETLFRQGATSQADFDLARTNQENAVETVSAAKEQVAQLAEPRTEDVRQAEAAVRESEAALNGAQAALQNAERAYKNRIAVRQALTNSRTEKATAQAGIAVAEADLHELKIGQRALIAPDAFPDLRLEGRVAEIIPAANSERGTVEVRIALNDPTEKLLPQLTADVNLITGIYKDALTLPRESLLDADTQPKVRLVENGRVVERALKVVKGDAGRIVVLEGLPADSVVLANPEAAKVGQEVKTTPAKTEAKP